MAQMSLNGAHKYLGYFSTPEEAYSSYIESKKEHVHNLMKDYPDQRVEDAVLEKVNAQA